MSFLKRLSRLLLPLALLSSPAVGAPPSGDDDCFWNPVTRQCTPVELLYAQPVDKLDAAQTRLFDEGLRQFRTVWTVFPRADGVWGLGPYFHANACTGCHINGGRGIVTEDERPVFQQLLRLSVPAKDGQGAPRPHPAYDQQLQPFSIFGPTPQPVTGEADLRILWVKEKTVLHDGSEVELRRPKAAIANARFGDIDPSVLTSLRNTPALLGLGYLDAVSEADILALAAAQKAQGLNGRPNYVVDDATGKRSLGRFGWKANQPSLAQQVAAAHLGDMGITTSLYPDDDCTGIEEQCMNFAFKKGGTPELDDTGWQAVNFFMAATEAPPQRAANDPMVRHGATLFRSAGCAACHVPELKAGKYPRLPGLEGERFHAYTDLLLHDMGEGLADGRPDFQAGPRDWRTAPLWGIGLSAKVNGSTDLLHDGRARNVQEAILWHGGEAKKARDAFAKLKREDRDALVAFVNSL